MNLQGVVYDTTSYQPVPGASLSIVAPSGSPLGGGTSADSGGLFNITSPQFDSGAKLLVSSVGYSSVIADPGVIVSSGMIGLNPTADTLASATVMAIRPAAKYLPWVIGGGIVVGVLASGKGKRRRRSRVSGDFPIDWTKVAITGGVLVGGYFAGKAILTKLGVISTPSPQQQATANAQAASLSAAQADAKSKGIDPSYTADQYTGWANDIYTIATGSWSATLSSDDQDKIVNDVINVNTMLDLQLLINAFGQRKGHCVFWICDTFDLQGFLKFYLDAAHLQTINQFLADTNINYQF
jgi:hypothetical protein